MNEHEPIYIMDSPLRDDANEGAGYEGRNGPLKKGPWSIEEDLVLAEYVTRHGEGNWNAVQRYTNLARCGKSCRLRWTNHLRPDLKKGVFTPEEERRVVELHAKMGNKWARMVPELPGRTDNEIKNFWNTRTKRRQRAGLPLYPADVIPEHGNENQQNYTYPTYSSNFAQSNNFEIPPMEFKSLDLEHNQQHLYPPHSLNMPSSSLMVQNLHSSYPNNSFLSTFNPSKRLKESDGVFPFNAGFGSFLPNVSQYQTGQSLNMVSSTYDGQNANISCSAKLSPALPSFQSGVGGWSSPSSPMASLDLVNILNQTRKTEQDQPCDISLRRSGLLEEVLFESKTMNNSNNASDLAVADVFDNSANDVYETEWETDGDFLSLPSEFSENLLDELVTALEGKSEATPPSLLPAQNVNEAETSNQNINSRPDLLLGSNFFASMATTTEDQWMLKDAMGTSIVHDLSLDLAKAGTSQSQGHQPDSCARNNAMSSP